MAGGKVFGLPVRYSYRGLLEAQRPNDLGFDRTSERSAVHLSREIAKEADAQVVVAIQAIRGAPRQEAALIGVM
jgi:hypothetical protein